MNTLLSRVRSYGFAGLTAVALGWSVVEAFLFVVERAGPDLPSLRDANGLAGGIQVLLVAAVAAPAFAWIMLQLRGSRREIARGAEYTRYINDFMYSASCLLASPPGQRLLKANGRSAGKSDATIMADRILACVTNSSRERRLPNVLLEPDVTAEDRLVPSHSDGLSTAFVDQFSASRKGNTVFAEALTTGEPVRIKDCAADHRGPAEGLEPGVRSMVCIPIQRPGENHHEAVYCVLSHESIAFTEVDERFYRACASLILQLGIIDEQKRPRDIPGRAAA